MCYLSKNGIECRANMRSFKCSPPIAYLACIFALVLTFPAFASDDLNSLKARIATSLGLDKAKVAAEIAFTLRQADANQALHYAQVALEQLEATPHAPTRVNVINTIAIAHLQKREYGPTTTYSELALQQAKDLSLAQEEARALNTLGGLNWYRGDLDQAKIFFESSLYLRKQHGAYTELSPALNNLGVIEETQGHYNKAIEFYLQAIAYADEIANDEQLARPISNLGILHQMLNNFDKALLFYQRSLELKLKVGNLVGAAVAHNNISEIQIEKGEYQEAIQSLQSGLSLLDDIEAPQEKALLLINSGSAYLYLNNPDKAFLFFTLAKHLLNRFNSTEIDSYLAQGYARAYLQKKQLDKALIHAQEFLILAHAKKNRNSVKKAHYLHYQIYKEKGLYLHALAAHEKFFRIQEELASTEKTDYVARLQAEFDSEKTEKELAILQKQNALHEIDIKRQHFLRNFIAILSLSILSFGFFIYRMRTIKIKTVLLEQKVIERTQEIQHKNVAIAELLKQKEKLLERKNALFSTVSHEFRTPLTLIMGPLKRLQNNTSNKETRLTLNNVHQNAMRLFRMVDQLLDLARIDMQAELANEPVDVNPALKFLVTSMETLFHEHEIDLNIHLDKGIWIEISPEALEKIVVNLLSNAVKYTPTGGTICVKAEAKNKKVMISISDTGIGIAKNQQNIIFERFTRLENQLSKPVPGTGIGLSLVKELVEHYNGKIEVHSEINQGSTFKITFPETTLTTIAKQKSLRSTASENELAALLPVKTVPAEKNVSNKPEVLSEKHGTVLIVEDNEEMRNFIGNLLNPNYHCFYAEDGKQGVNLAIKEIPDLIISDLMMPNLSGLDLAAMLKEDQLTSHIPVIILTAKGDPETRHAAWRKNVDEYIEKPFDADELLLRCENILSIRQLLTQRSHLRAPAEKINENSSVVKNNSEHSYFNPRDQAFLDKLYCYLEKNFYENQLNAKLISNALAITEKQLQRKVKALTDDTIPACVRNFRLKKGAEMLTAGASITNVAFDVGFSSQSYFSTAFAARYGCSPSDYQLRKRKIFEKSLTS